jgi:hypothetical protein
MLTWREDFEQMSGKFSVTAKIYCVSKFYDFATTLYFLSKLFFGNRSSSTLYSLSKLCCWNLSKLCCWNLSKLCCWNLSKLCCCLVMCGDVGRCHVGFGEKTLDLEHRHAGG